MKQVKLERVFLGIAAGIIALIAIVGFTVNDIRAIPEPTFQNEQMAIYQEGHVYDVHMEVGLGGAMANIVLVSILNKATTADTVRIHVSGYGGDFATGMKLITAIKESKAHTVGIVEGPAYSAFSIIPLVTNETIIKENAGFIFHTVQKGSGPFSRPEPAVLPGDKFITPWVNVHKALGIFTEAEMKLMFEEGVDLFLTGKEVKERLGL